MRFAKVFTDILGDPKLMSASRKGKVRELTLLPWLIVFAKLVDDDGRLTVNGEAAEPADIAAMIPCTSARKVMVCIDELAALGVLILDDVDANIYRFAAWDLRAGSKPSDSPSAIRERVQRHRERKRGAGNADEHEGETRGGNALQGDTGNATEKEKEKEKEKRGRGKRKNIVASDDAGDDDANPSSKTTWLTPFADAWRERYGGEMPMGVAAKALKPLVDEWGTDEVRRRWGHYLAATEGAFANAARFAATFGEWNTVRVKGAPAAAAKQTDAAYLRAAALWPLYRRLGFISAIPSKHHVTMAADDMVAEGAAPTPESFIAELKIARPWDFPNVKSDAFAIDQIAVRLRTSAAAADAADAAQGAAA